MRIGDDRYLAYRRCQRSWECDGYRNAQDECESLTLSKLSPPSCREQDWSELLPFRITTRTHPETIARVPTSGPLTSGFLGLGVTPGASFDMARSSIVFCERIMRPGSNPPLG